MNLRQLGPRVFELCPSLFQLVDIEIRLARRPQNDLFAADHRLDGRFQYRNDIGRNDKSAMTVSMYQFTLRNTHAHNVHRRTYFHRMQLSSLTTME